MWYSFSTPDEPLPCRYVVPPSTTSSFVPSVSRPRSERDARRGPANAQTAFVYPRHYQPFSLISPRNRLVPSRLVPFRPVPSRPNPSHFAALLVNRGSIVRSVLGNDESTSVKLASRFRPRFSECLLLPRSDEKSFSSDDPRWIHGGRTIDGPIDRQDGSVSVNEIGQPVLDYVSPFVDCTETTATLNGRHSARSTRGQIFFFSFLFFPPRSFRSDRNVYNEERSREGERERGKEREEEEEEPPRRILLGRGGGYRVLFRRMITSFVQRPRTGSRVERERKQLFIWDRGGRGGLKACALYGYWQQLFYNADNCWRAGATVTGVAVASGSGARW